MRHAIVLTLGLLLAACARPAPPPAPAGAPPPAAAMPAPPPAGVNQTALGPILADPQGMTLYTFTRDARGVSNCNGRCAVAWPPFKAAPGAQGSGQWSVIRRADGTMQWADNGQPLYTYEKDKKPGDTTGEGVLQTWHVARP